MYGLRKRELRSSLACKIAAVGALTTAFYSGFRSYGEVAQLVEHATENRGAGGSIPHFL